MIATAQRAHANTSHADHHGERQGQWEVLDTPNFRILHLGSAMARPLAERAEKQRLALIRYWGSARSAMGTWTPKCTIYLYPNNRELVRMTGGGPKAGSALARQSVLMQGKVFSRRINLAADDHRLLTATLPHEITHVVVKDLARDIPRWADEGMAMYSESNASTARRARSLRYAVVRGPFYRVETLMQMTRYPDRSYVHLYYAQSYALTRMLLESGGPKRFISFLRKLRRRGFRYALYSHYGHGDLEALQVQYLAYVKKLAGGS